MVYVIIYMWHDCVLYCRIFWLFSLILLWVISLTVNFSQIIFYKIGLNWNWFYFIPCGELQINMAALSWLKSVRTVDEIYWFKNSKTLIMGSYSYWNTCIPKLNIMQPPKYWTKTNLIQIICLIVYSSFPVS